MSLETVTAGEAVIRVVRAESVRHVSALPGVHVLAISDVLYDAPGIVQGTIEYYPRPAEVAAVH